MTIGRQKLIAALQKIDRAEQCTASLLLSCRFSTLRQSQCGALLLALLVTPGCNTFEETRPPTEIHDTVDVVNPSLLAGMWSCTTLNPYPDEPTFEQEVVFNTGGSMFSEYVAPMSNAVPGAGDVRVTLIASWSVEGSRIATRGTDVTTMPMAQFQGGTPLLPMGEATIQSAAEIGWNGAGTVLKQTPEKLVIRADGSDPPIFACDRG